MRRGLVFVRQAVAEWRPQADAMAVDAIVLAGAELLANAADHAGGPTALELSFDPGTSLLRIAVTDTSPARPRLRAVRPEEPHGRGMRIIDHLATAWGCHANGAGKTVWADLPLP
ncbi:ATP-binding protein [Streptomyces sp. NRRL B-24484]|uniref:ATP-binding protein n=1 Tax=Streptomyces sp. NRRL B-24484 TaxID=1463833 RepID=UPI000AA03A4D|nr:ATP-binding protein [Streptomyces sp. NRRL B-24484]